MTSANHKAFSTALPINGENSDAVGQIASLVETKAAVNPMKPGEIARFAIQLYKAFADDVSPPQAEGVESEVGDPQEETAEEAAPKWKGVRAPDDPFCDPMEAIHDDYIISLEDGEKFVMLKRALRERYGMTEAEYKEKFGLPADYPMVAPSYSRKKAAAAKTAGLGKHRRAKGDAKAPVAA